MMSMNKVYSEVITIKVFSEEDTDFRPIEEALRITEQTEVRTTETDQERILE